VTTPTARTEGNGLREPSAHMAPVRAVDRIPPRSTARVGALRHDAAPHPSSRSVNQVLRRLHLLLLKIFQRLPTAARVFAVHRLAPTFTVGSICVIERADGRILLVRHSYRRRWGFPGGLLKRGEPAEDAARRESLEEVGLPIDIVGEPTVVVDPGPRRVDTVWACRPANGADPDSVKGLSPEVVEVAWFAADDLPELQHEASGALVALARARGWGRFESADPATKPN
jgi:8-oxo-dGTP diphosphatase